MKRATCLIRVLPGLLLGVSAAATAAEPPAKSKPNVLRVTPFVAGKAESMVRKATTPKNEKEAVARKRKLPSGITVMELPEDRTNHLVQVRQPDGSTRIMHMDAIETSARLPAPTSEVK